MSPSWNQRRAIPVVTITTFQLGVSGVASRSRLTTPTRSSVRAEDRFGDGANRECFPGAGAGDDAESLAGARKLENFLAVLALQQRVEVQPHGELDGLARRARGCNDDDASRRGLRGRECFAIRRKVVIANVTQCRSAILGRRVENDERGGRCGFSVCGRGAERRAPACAAATAARDWRRAAPAPRAAAAPPRAAAPALRAAAACLLLLRGAVLLLARRQRVGGGEVRLPRTAPARHVATVSRRFASEHDARVQRPLANGRRTIGWRRLMRRRHAVDPDAAHSRRRSMALGHIARRGLCV